LGVVDFTEKKFTTGGVFKGTETANWVPLIAFDCRGLEITKWYPGVSNFGMFRRCCPSFDLAFPQTGFTCQSEPGYLFEDVDLSEDWAEYDDENDLSVEITELEHKFDRH
jgi:hypothetical protein